MKVKVTIDTGYVGTDYEDIIEVADNATDDDIDRVAMNYLWDHVSLSWAILKNKEND